MKKILSLVLVVASFSAAAAPSVAEYPKIKDNNIIKMYVLGLGEAFLYSTITLEFNKKEPLFCPPRKMALTTENYVQILDEQLLEDKGVEKDTPIGLVLLDGLRRTFPCKR